MPEKSLEGRERARDDARDWMLRLASPVKRRPFFDLLALLRSAPIMLLFCYGPALLYLVAGALLAGVVSVQALASRLGMPLASLAHGEGAEVFRARALLISLLLVVIPVPLYWVTTGIYRLGWRAHPHWRRTPPIQPENIQPEKHEQPPDRAPSEPVPALVIRPPRSPGLDGSAGIRACPEAPTDFDQSAFRFRRIGLVLSGGGAKGIYQAGAMRAIHDFLAEHDSLDAVVSVAGTSIGSWNALFWLAGLVGPRPGESEGFHQRWWRGYRLFNLVRPASIPVLPGITSHLMENDPWQREFERIFERKGEPGYEGLTRHLAPEIGRPLPSRCHFYFSRTNVLPGRLAFDTNHKNAVDVSATRTHDMDQGRLATSTDHMRQAVFTSMAIPPLFPYSRLSDQKGSEWCEDGGVIDNLPIRLATAFDDCDLLFILPLNANFNTPDKPRSLVSRLSRVIEVRQGVLERGALKLVYLFNKQSALQAATLHPPTGPPQAESEDPCGEHRSGPIPAFILSPGQPMRIQTTELWRNGRLRNDVFEQMRQATAEALVRFFDHGRLARFFEAYQQVKDGNKIGRDGWTRMQIVDPCWMPGNQLDEEVRF